MYKATEGDTFEEGWRNNLIWCDNLLVMGSLLEKLVGKIDFSANNTLSAAAAATCLLSTLLPLPSFPLLAPRACLRSLCPSLFGA